MWMLVIVQEGFVAAGLQVLKVDVLFLPRFRMSGQIRLFIEFLWVIIGVYGL